MTLVLHGRDVRFPLHRRVVGKILKFGKFIRGLPRPTRLRPRSHNLPPFTTTQLTPALSQLYPVHPLPTVLCTCRDTFTAPNA